MADRPPSLLVFLYLFLMKLQSFYGYHVLMSTMGNFKALQAEALIVICDLYVH